MICAVSCPGANPLLTPGAQQVLAVAFEDYPHSYDQVLEEVHARLNAVGMRRNSI
jgi:hypothetical protein